MARSTHEKRRGAEERGRPLDVERRGRRVACGVRRTICSSSACFFSQSKIAFKSAICNWRRRSAWPTSAFIFFSCGSSASTSDGCVPAWFTLRAGPTGSVARTRAWAHRQAQAGRCKWHGHSTCHDALHLDFPGGSLAAVIMVLSCGTLCLFDFRLAAASRRPCTSGHPAASPRRVTVSCAGSADI
jgi:hypothetical protein